MPVRKLKSLLVLPIIVVSLFLGAVACNPSLERDVSDSRKELSEMRRTFKELVKEIRFMGEALYQLNVNAALIAVAANDISAVTKQMEAALAFFMATAFEEYDPDKLASDGDFDDIDDSVDSSDSSDQNNRIPGGVQ